MAGGQNTGGMTNVPGSKPMMLPMGSRVQMAHPWASNQPAWMSGVRYQDPWQPGVTGTNPGPHGPNNDPPYSLPKPVQDPWQPGITGVMPPARTDIPQGYTAPGVTPQGYTGTPTPPQNPWQPGVTGTMPMPRTMPQGSMGAPAWRMPLFPAGLLSPLLLPGRQAQTVAATAAPATTAPTATGAASPATPAPATPPTQSAVSTAIGSAIDPSVMAGLSPEERANYQIDPASGTWIRVR